MFSRMARKPRLDVPSGFYHILARGNPRATIFHDDANYTPTQYVCLTSQKRTFWQWP